MSILNKLNITQRFKGLSYLIAPTKKQCYKDFMNVTSTVTLMK